MQISFVMLLFSDQISGGGKSLQEGQTASGGAPCGRKPAFLNACQDLKDHKLKLCDMIVLVLLISKN